MTGVAFQTRARTIDHLGREQIADTPTAVSELWKNAYDAYARNVELNLFDGPDPIAAVTDDGHGMNYEEFTKHWLVIGTESKAGADRTPIEDRFGLRFRMKQGQKGIGRLSSAKLGSTLLLISKRENCDFVVALIDWRVFENPYLNLSDIQFPVNEVKSSSEILRLLPSIKSSLMENIIGDAKHKDARLQRVHAAWLEWEKEAGPSDTPINPISSKVIASSINSLNITERHLRNWAVWNGKGSHGTGLFVSNINNDFEALLAPEINDTAAMASRRRFFETLSSFVDPFTDPVNSRNVDPKPELSYSARRWVGDKSSIIIGTETEFNLRNISSIEHQIDGQIDEEGVFTGRIKAFGAWMPDDVIIRPPKNIRIPTRGDSKLGPIGIYIGAMEFAPLSTTHSHQEFEAYKALAEKYSGFMVFRDGLKVLPFGRSDSDFFEIEDRRSRNAGREFWNQRQMFGRLAISRENNPNLKDKAGREGLIDNLAAQTLRELISYLLKYTARQFFGSSSKGRKEILPEIQKNNRAKKAEEERNKLRKRERKAFAQALTNKDERISEFTERVFNFADKLEINDEADLASAYSTLSVLRDETIDFRLPEVPSSLGPLEKAYLRYKGRFDKIISILASIDDRLAAEVAQRYVIDPIQFLNDRLNENAAQLKSRIERWQAQISALQRAEFERVRQIRHERMSFYDNDSAALLHELRTDRITLEDASIRADALKQKYDAENALIFAPYINALESLKESIDIDLLAGYGASEASELRTEIDRLNSLAQLGISVEIIGHELQSYDYMIGNGLRKLPKKMLDSEAVKDIAFGYEGITDQLRFLSPLRLAGQRIQKWITGEEIFAYVSEFFRIPLAHNKIQFSISDKFKYFRVFDQQSRLLPVFINLVNNSIYWLSFENDITRKIIFDIIDGKIIISDNGPGVSPEDIDSLFSLFFTKKVRGGRGVGLYLAKSNLAAGGHRIAYRLPSDDLPLGGANFEIDFVGAELP
ncbi:MAG: ATP-binding protein [Sphingomonadales bacterium]|nr:ATP-binding protein [Sphingomonadales bacterium]